MMKTIKTKNKIKCPNIFCKKGYIGSEWNKDLCPLCKGKSEISLEKYKKFEYNKKIEKEMNEAQQEIRARYTKKLADLHNAENSELQAVYKKFEKNLKKVDKYWSI